MIGLRLRHLVAGLLLAVLGVSVLPGSAAADPKPSLNEVQRRVDDLNRQAEQAAERYNTAKVELTEANRQLRSVKNRYALTQRRLDAMKTLVGRIAVASYKAGSLDSSVQLILSDNPTQFLRQASDLTQVNRQQDAMLRGMETARLRAAADRKAVAEQRARAQDLQQRIAAERRTVEARLASARDLLGRLEAKQRARMTFMRQEAVDRSLGARDDAMRASRSSRGDDFPTVGRSGFRPRRRRRQDRVRPARRPLRLRRGRPQRLRLLRPDDVLLGRRGRLAAALVVGAVLRGPAHLDLRPAAGRPGLLLQPDQPRRHLHRRRPDHRRALPGPQRAHHRAALDAAGRCRPSVAGAART